MAYVTIFMAWPYANGPLHLGHVAGNCLPADVQYRYERARGRRVLMCSGSDEHGTPITLTAEEMCISPQDVVDKYHEINTKALADLGCSWVNPVDPRGIEFGGALYNRTSDPLHKEMVQEVFTHLLDSGFLERKSMQQYCSVNKEGHVRFLPDRYVEGKCPSCSEDNARGDQCDSCGATYEAHELVEPRSKLDEDSEIEVRDTEHFFLRLNDFQKSLEAHCSERQDVWKPNVRSMSKNWLDMGLRARAVTRDIEWGIEIPLDGDDWASKRIYVWFEAVQGYYTCARIWAERYAAPSGHSDGIDAWENWWKVPEDGDSPRHIYFMGKDNIPFHTIIWPAIIMGLNASDSSEISHSPTAGDLLLEDNVSSNEYLMLKGGQFSKSRRHGVWLPSYLERYDPDALRYYLSINMPETHDTDFRWDEYVDRVNNELIGTYGNFVHRVMTLTHRLPSDGENPLASFDNPELHKNTIDLVGEKISSAIDSMERQRFKEALRSIMGIAQMGNSIIQEAAPWKYLNEEDSAERRQSLSSLALSWRICSCLAVCMRPFTPFSSDRLWSMLGNKSEMDSILLEESMDAIVPLSWNPETPAPLFSRLDLEEILQSEESLSDSKDNDDAPNPDAGGGYIEFDDFMKVEMRTGRIISVEDHPNADKLYVITLQDAPDSTRTVCAGLKDFYEPSELEGLDVIFVANLEPRKLRGVLSEGMLLAADDEDGNVRVLTTEGEISSGSRVK
ncbi:MAG TPA: methionine--tRNA ligase [Candidatus Poseidoniales archaeon]|nr:MAG: methionine--tRNA ligase [Euryarchaeota archaeon]HIG34204.1 methionine--tRNA ligase [Candidatus Poseidoniales archaeon]HIL67767.1 methionine--tRNA ligase [Candidatus Poseidoniales archaeon]